MKMLGKLFWGIFFVALFLGLPSDSFAEMQSPNYRLPTSVLSGGGVPTGSTNYQTNSTLGQPSPLMDPADPPSSSNYNLEPGFWYTVKAASVCRGDFEPDGDVDGLDLDIFNSAFAIGDLTADLDNSGIVDTNDLTIFASEFGRIDCP